VRPLVFISQRWARLHAIGLELGYSRGPFKDFVVSPDSPASTYSYEGVQWLQPQITYETRSYRGFNLLGGLGVEIPFESHGYQCLVDSECGSHKISPLPTITLGLGWATGL
jgi:hypothetical protein